MTWATFAVTAAQMRAKEPGILDKMSDVDVIALYQVQAKTEMLFDLLDAAGVTDSTSSSIETILTDHEARLQEALCYKQLSLYYGSLGGEIGSLNRYKHENYANKYQLASRAFGNMVFSGLPKTDFMTFTR